MATRKKRKPLVIATLLLGLGAACDKPVPPPPPPVEVYVTPVTQKDVPVYLELVGQTSGYQDVEIRARVEGFLENVSFKEGSFVKKGDLLYSIDRKPLEAELAAAKADQQTAEADLSKADNDVNRYTPLVAKQAVSREELDNALARQAAAKAKVDAAKAAVQTATIELGYTTAVAPIDGLVGTTQVKAGNLVGRGENTLLTTISQTNPILLRVGVTEADYLKVVRRSASRGSASSGSAEGIELTLADGTLYTHTGKVRTVERAVDPTTGTLGIELEFPNPENLLRPGQYGKARLLLENKVAAMLVPQRAVQELQGLYSVAVVDSSGKVVFRSVKVGPRVESLWVIEDGVKPGEQVIVEGLQRVQDGMTVTAKPAPAAAPSGSQPAPAGSK
jgi:membrane fusion protein, multidrug efflux system